MTGREEGGKVATVAAALGKLCVMWIRACELLEGASGLGGDTSSSVAAKMFIIYPS